MHFASCGTGALGLGAALLLSGCHNFFVCDKASCPSSGGGGSSTTDYAYVSNASKGSTYVAEYNVGNGSLAAISGSPFNMTFVPVAMTVAPNNAYLYAATLPTATNPGIYLFSINSSTGALSAAASGNVLITGTFASMDISPDGNYLFTLDSLGTTLNEYKIDSSTGLLALAGSFPLPPGGLCALSAGTPVTQTCTVKAGPSGQFVATALGTTGTEIFPYNSTSGITSTSAKLIPSGSTQANPTGDFSVTLDKNNYLYIARTSALAVYQITDSTGTATLRFNQTYSNTAVPRSVVLNSGENYVYTANEGAGTISAFGVGANGTLTQVSGSPFAGPATASALGVDKSGKYMVAAGYNGSSGVQLLSIGTTGSLSLTTSAGTGTSTTIPVVLAMSH